MARHGDISRPASRPSWPGQIPGGLALRRQTVRIQTRRLAALLVPTIAVLASAGIARADGEIHLRGAYYKEKATRVAQPMLDARLDVSEDTELSGHFLVDSITSASVASGAAGQAFTENRLEGGLSVTHRIDNHQTGVFFRYSDEPDYKSLFAGLRGLGELAEKNTTVGWSLAVGRDRISNEGAQDPDGMGQFEAVEGTMTTVVGSLSMTQLLAPWLQVGATYDLIHHDGFLENPYRFVFVGGVQLFEQVPDSRLRQALFGNLRAYIPMTRTAVIAGYRLYADDWDVIGHTPDIRLVQEVVDQFDLHLRYRYHRQNQASFFRQVYDAPSLFFTDDVKLSAFDSHTFTLKLDTALSNLGLTGRMGEARVDLLVSYVIQNNRYGDAVVAQFGMEIPLQY